jgi:hypothetical protein
MTNRSSRRDQPRRQHEPASKLLLAALIMIAAIAVTIVALL